MSSFIFSGPGHPAWNMAVDEALLRNAQEEKTPRLILRFYGWDRPSISIGYFQRYQTARAALGNDAARWTIQRRPTGGGAVRHDRDITYSLIYPVGTLPYPSNGSVPSAYRDYYFVHDLLRQTLSSFQGLSLSLRAPRKRGEAIPKVNAVNVSRVTDCFAQPSPYDLMLGNEKIAGAAQRRSKGWILHQGSIVLSRKMTDAEREQLTTSMTQSFEKTLSRSLAARELSHREAELAQDIFLSLYNTPSWNQKF